MTDFVSAVALAIIILGLAHAAFPAQMKRAALWLHALPISTLRAVALACAAGGLILLWLARG
ncbi:MAG TPA: DUF2065 domain-containing protein [Devosiaceae bacterium]